MDSSDWLQGTSQEDTGIMDSSSSPSGDMLACSRVPLMERRLRPQHEQALKCPRCESTHTKFCYYNNYSLSQPRYFCKTCRRYWTKGGTHRNIPVGGGCRKNNKKVINPSKKSNIHYNQSMINHQNPGSSSSSSSSQSPTYLQLSFPQQSKYSGNVMLENPNNYEALVGSTSRNHDFMGISDGDLSILAPYNFHALSSPFGITLDGISCTGPFMDNYQRLMLPYEDQNAVDVKPNGKLLALEWQDQGCYDAGIKDSCGYSVALDH